MTIQRALSAVRDALDALVPLVREVAVAVDDVSADGDLAVLDAMREHAVEIEGDAAETAAALRLAIAEEAEGDAARAARALASAHERFSTLARRVRSGLSAYGSRLEIQRLAARRGGAWRRWSEVVLRQLEQVDDALYRADAAFVASWQEIADVALHAPSHPRLRKETVHA